MDAIAAAKEQAAAKAAAAKEAAAAAKQAADAKKAIAAAPKGDALAKGYATSATNWPVSLGMHRYFLTGVLPFKALQPLIAMIPVFGSFLGPMYDTFCVLFGSILFAFGANGANLIVSGSMAYGLMKFGTNFMLDIAYSMIANKFPGQSWLPFLKTFIKYANPWYTFDMVQAWSPQFAREGYKIPFMNRCLNSQIYKNEGTKDANQKMANKRDANGQPVGELTVDNGEYVEGTKKPGCLTALKESDIGFQVPKADGTTETSYGRMKLTVFGALALLLLPWYMEFTSTLPPEYSAKFESWTKWGLNTFGAIMGVGSAVLAGGMYAIPGALPALKGLFTSSAPAAAPAAPAVMTGGGLPDLNDVIQDTLNNTPDEVPFNQDGGGLVDADESSIFLGSLAIASLVGIGLAVMRNKKLSRESV